MTCLEVGDIIEYQQRTWRIRSNDGSALTLRCLDGGPDLTLPIGALLADPTLRGPDEDGPTVADQRLLDQMSPNQRRMAEFWYEHLYEVRNGISLRDRGVVEPTAMESSVTERLETKREELNRLGFKVSVATMWRKWVGFRRRGVVGCADQRGLPGRVRVSQLDQRIVATLDQVRQSFVSESTPTKKQLIELTRTRLNDQGLTHPSRSTMYKLLELLDRGEHITGDATSRRSYANSPDRPYNKIVALFPGEEVQLDATPLDAMALMADGEPRSVELAAGIDVATRTITAAIVRPNALKTVDALELWANSAVPQQMIPGWTENMDIARNYIPDLPSQADLETALAQKPLIDVRGLVVDNGKIFVSKAFERATETRGVHHRPAPSYTPTGKPHIERLLSSIADDFVRWIPGYKGRSVSHRGRRPDKNTVWPLPLLQALLDVWILTVYQIRKHSGLVLPMAPRMDLSPNAMYRALRTVAPTPARSLTRDEWISLQPHAFRKINRYGVNFGKLVYDSQSPEFHALRRTRSPNSKQNGKWEIRYDPNNLMQIWVRNESLTRDEDGRQVVTDKGWIECRWVLAKYVTVPFGIDVLEAIKLGSKEPVTDKLVLDRAEQMHRMLLAGPGVSKVPALSPTEASVGRANLARQQISGVPPAGGPVEPAAALPPRTQTSRPTTPGSDTTEVMRPVRLSDGW